MRILTEILIVIVIFICSVVVYTAARPIFTPILPEWIIIALALFCTILAVPFIDSFTRNTITSRLFKKRYAYQKTLDYAVYSIATARDFNKLFKLIVHLILRKTKVGRLQLFLFDKTQNQFRLKASRGIDSVNRTVYEGQIGAADPLAEWMRITKAPVSMRELEQWMRQRHKTTVDIPGAVDLTRMNERMHLLHAAMAFPILYRNSLSGILAIGDVGSSRTLSKDAYEFFRTVCHETAIALKNIELYLDMEEKTKEIEALYQREYRLFMHASIAFAAAIDARDPYTHGHSERVTGYCIAILKQMDKMPLNEDIQDFKERLQIAAVLHDIGKIGISDDILHKPASLTPEEKRQIERHAVIGADIVSHIKGLLDIVGPIRSHHERYDGRGYPEGLKDKEIPLMAKIIAVADAYDAIISSRPYHKEFSAQKARDEILCNSATQFDPSVVQAFLMAFDTGEIQHAP